MASHYECLITDIYVLSQMGYDVFKSREERLTDNPPQIPDKYEKFYSLDGFYRIKEAADRMLNETFSNLDADDKRDLDLISYAAYEAIEGNMKGISAYFLISKLSLDLRKKHKCPLSKIGEDILEKLQNEQENYPHESNFKPDYKKYLTGMRQYYV